MRRTPACFVDEEEAHPQKMLDAGVIQPSISEWASAPVLIRKRDGGVRWCIDYRKTHLNALKRSKLCGERLSFFYLLVLFLPANMHYWHQALNTDVSVQSIKTFFN
jgi:hypothetical protein